MSLLLNNEIPENYRERIEKRVTYIVMSRCGWLLPAAMCIVTFFMILVGATSIWGDGNSRFIYLDSITLIILGFIYFLYKKYHVDRAEDIVKQHHLIQIAISGIVILWGAMITAFDTNTAVGYATFIVSVMLVGGLMYIRPGRLILMSVFGFGLTHTVRMIMNISFVTFDVLQEVILFGFVLFLALIINRFNVSIILKTLLLELDLETKVEERTRQLSEETIRAQRSDMLKSAFLANMSHEIRTPLNGIIGFTNLLKRSDIDPDEQKKYIDIVSTSGNILLEILNDIMEVSRIESGACELFEEKICLNDVFEEVLDIFQSHEKISSGVLVLVNRAKAVPRTYINSDRLKIVQIMVNLVSNAIKYSDKGTISVDFTPAHSDNIEIRVADTGKGIKPDELEHIFERFHQVDLDPYRRTDGIGLGLTIVKGYMDLLGGSISVDSEFGMGTEFRLLLPSFIK